MDVLDKGFGDGVARQEEKRRQQQRLLDVLKEHEEVGVTDKDTRDGGR